MALTSIDSESIALTDAERSALTRIDSMLQRTTGVPMLAGATEEPVQLPASLVRALRRVVHLLANDQAIAILPVDTLLTTQQAADLVNVSRPYLIRLLDQGAIPYTRTGTHRRIRLADLLDYKRQRDAERAAALDALTRMSQEFGLYGIR